MRKKCTNPEIGRLLARYEFGIVTNEEKKKFEKHLLECDVCYKELYSFLPVTETIKNNIEDFRAALRPKKSIVSKTKIKLFNIIKDMVDTFNTLPQPLRVILPVIAMIVMVIIVYFFSSPGQYKDFNLIVQKSSEKSILHPPETIESNAYGDSLTSLKFNGIEERKNFAESFMKGMFIEKNNDRRALIFRWPHVPNINYYQYYLTLIKNGEVISPVKTINDTLFMYPIENIPKNQTVMWNLSVYYKDGEKFIFNKKFKINY